MDRFIGYARVLFTCDLFFRQSGVPEVREGEIVEYHSPLTNPYRTPLVKILARGIYYGWTPANNLKPLSPLEMLALQSE